MTSLIQSILAFLLGLALSLFGFIQTVCSYPGTHAFAQFAATLPALGSVMFFVLCIVAAIAGVLVLVISVKKLRHRWHYLRQITDQSSSRNLNHGYAHRNGQSTEEEEQWAGSYR